MHWADVIAKRLREAPEGAQHTIATGITPSGHIHVGNMREILTGDLVQRAAKDIGLNVRLIYIGDTIDPLRKVYPFLPESYSEHVGKPLCNIPCPCGNHSSYAEHFLEPFLQALEKLGVEHETKLSHEMYQDGQYTEGTHKVLSNIDTCRNIITTISKRELPKNWFPYNPICSNCGSITDTRPSSYSRPFVDYHCDKCGNDGQANIELGEGKLPWRIDWPARWDHLGVTCEPFGKDHAAAGGSYETGTELAKQIFDNEPPEPVVYEWIQLKGKGAMASSTGVVVTAEQMLKMTPPEVLRFLIAKYKPVKHIDFDPGLGLLNIIDDFDRYERVYYGSDEGFQTPEERRTYVLSLSDLDEVAKVREMLSFDESGDMVLDTSGLTAPVQIQYRHLVTLSQLTDDLEQLKVIIQRAEGLDIDSLDVHSRKVFDTRLDCVKFWIENSAPEGVVFSVRKEMTDELVSGLEDSEKDLISRLADILEPQEWTAENIHQSFYTVAEDAGVKSGAIFKAAYKSLLAKERGPRLGYFLSTLEKDFVIQRFRLQG